MCSSARMMSLAALVVCFGVISSVMADSNDEYYYNSLYRDGEGYNDKNVRNLDGIETQLDAWLMLGYPQMLFQKRHMDSIGGDILLQKRFQEPNMEQKIEHRMVQEMEQEMKQKLKHRIKNVMKQKMEQGMEQKMKQNHQENAPSLQNLMEEIHQQTSDPKIIVQDAPGRIMDSTDSLRKWTLSNKLPRVLAQKRQIDSIGGGSLLKRGSRDVRGESKPGFAEYVLDGWANSKIEPEFLAQKRQMESIGGGSLLKRSFVNKERPFQPEFLEYLSSARANTNNKPKFLTQKRQMESIGGGSLLKRNNMNKETQLQNEFDADLLKKLTNSNIGPEFLVQKRQMESIGGGSLLKRSFIDEERPLQPEFAEYSPNKWGNYNIKPKFFTQKRQMESIGGGSLLKRSLTDKVRPEFDNNFLKKFTNSNIRSQFLTQKRQIDSIGGGSLLKRSFADQKIPSVSQKVAQTQNNGERRPGQIDLEDLEKLFKSPTSIQDPKIPTNDRFSNLRYVEHLLGEYLANQKPKIQMTSGTAVMEVPVEDHSVGGAAPLMRGTSFPRYQGLGEYLDSLKPKIQINRGSTEVGLPLEEQNSKQNPSAGMREVGSLVEMLNGQQNSLMGNAFSGGLSAGKELGYPTEVGNGQMQDFVGRHSFGGNIPNQATQVAYKQLMDSVVEAAPKLQFKDVLNQSVLKEVEGRLISQRPRIQIKAPSSGLEVVGKPSQP